MSIGLAMLAFNRPLHTALAVAYAIFNKEPDTHLHVFYSIHRNTPPPSRCLDGMLKQLHKAGLLELHYLMEDRPQNCGGNVDTLMLTMTSLYRHDGFLKIDDDVLIGKNTPSLLTSMQRHLEQSDGVYLLMGQAVREHMQQLTPFDWTKEFMGYTFAQRSKKACPMETYTAVSPRLFEFLRSNDKTVTCDIKSGTYQGYTRKLTEAGGKSALVLTPHIEMQHIGLNSIADPDGIPRTWAPATAWDPPGYVIPIQHFDFAKWESLHEDDRLVSFTIDTIAALAADPGATSMMAECAGTLIRWLEAYSPDLDTPLPLKPKRLTGEPVKIVRDGKVLPSPPPKKVVVQRPIIKRKPRKARWV